MDIRFSYLLAVAASTLIYGIAFAQMPPNDLEAIGEAAVAGVPAAQVALGQKFRSAGLPAEAADWFCAAAQRGDPDGLYWCGRSLVRGYGRGIDLRTGTAMLDRSARTGNAESALLLGDLSPGREAESWYALASDNGAAEGAFRLGELLERRGARTSARDAYSRASQAGHPAATNALALWLLNDPARTAETLAQATHLFRIAAAAGDQAATYNLGNLLSAKDPANAYRYLALAAIGANRGIRADAERRMEALAVQISPEVVEAIRREVANDAEAKRKLVPHRPGELD